MGCEFDPTIAAIEVIGILKVLVAVLVNADKGACLQVIVSIYLFIRIFANYIRCPRFGISLTCKASNTPASGRQPHVWPGTTYPGD